MRFREWLDGPSGRCFGASQGRAVAGGDVEMESAGGDEKRSLYFI